MVKVYAENENTLQQCVRHTAFALPELSKGYELVCLNKNTRWAEMGRHELVAGSQECSSRHLQLPSARGWRVSLVRTLPRQMLGGVAKEVWCELVTDFGDRGEPHAPLFRTHATRLLLPTVSSKTVTSFLVLPHIRPS